MQSASAQLCFLELFHATAAAQTRTKQLKQLKSKIALSATAPHAQSVTVLPAQSATAQSVQLATAHATTASQQSNFPFRQSADADDKFKGRIKIHHFDTPLSFCLFRRLRHQNLNATETKNWFLDILASSVSFRRLSSPQSYPPLTSIISNRVTPAPTP